MHSGSGPRQVNPADDTHPANSDNRTHQANPADDTHQANSENRTRQANPADGGWQDFGRRAMTRT